MAVMIEATKRCAEMVGGLPRLAELLQIKRPSLYSWKRIPAERVLELERLTKISRHDLRPDLYPRDETEVA